MSILKTAAASKVARFTVIAGLVGASIVGLTSATEAATTPTLTLSTSTGSASGGDLITVKGKGFMDDAYSNLVLGWDFTNAVCGTTPSSDAGTAGGSLAAGVLNVTSATSATVKTPTGLTAGTWYLCFWDASSGTAGIIGQAKFVTGTAPAITSTNLVTEATGTDVTASSLGGTLVSLVGTDFTKKSVVSVDGVAATKTTYVSATKVTAVLPKHAPGSDYGIKITTEYGSMTTTGVLVDYAGVASVSPPVGAASTVTAIQLTGMGFNAYNTVGFGDGALAASKYVIAFVPGGVTFVAGTSDLTGAGFTGVKYCAKVLVDSDTSLSCQTPNNLTGAYSVQILRVVADAKTLDSAVNGGVTTVAARVSTFTAASL